MDYKKNHAKKFWGHLFSMPFIWLPLPALILFDIAGEIYQAVCFPIYGIEKVKRSEYILIMDRTKLPYLNWAEKIGCMYCGYANGFLLYAKEIAGRTEKYWCGIKHEEIPGFKPQAEQTEKCFAKFGDEKDFKDKYENQ
jgi:hypothetical protein